MTGPAGWSVVATYGRVYEAEMAKARLESIGIPAQVLGEHIGVFGPGWSGMAIRGVRLVVPSVALQDALAALEEFDEDAGYEVSDGADDGDEDDDAPDWGPGVGRRG